jgi:cyclophilin family peptidyl-prolyl cis-trans isomerase
MPVRRRSPRFELLEDRHLLTAGPTLLPLSNVTLLAGAPQQIPINATSPSGYSFTYSVTSTNPAITATLPTTNPDLALTVTHTSSGQPGDTSFSGTIIIELFPDQAPDTVTQIENLVNEGFYNGVVFQRVVAGFVNQAGEPTAADSGITIPTIDDEINAGLRFSSAGVVGMARTSDDDTNSSEFFITAAAQPSLDYQYTIFGQVVSGEAISADINSVPVDSNSDPLSPVTITSAQIINDTDDLALDLSAPVGTTGTGSITVSANDGHGDTALQTFQVTVQADPNDPGPFLETIPTVTTTVNTPDTFQLPAFDLEGDPVTYYDQTGLQSNFGLSPTQTISSDLNVSVNSTTGLVTVTPTNGLVGVTPMLFGVASSATPSSPPSTHMVPLFIDPAAPTGISLEAASDTGSSDSDDITSLNNSDPSHELQFLVTGVTSGDTVTLMDGTEQIGSAVATSSSVVVTTDGSTVLADGTNQITAEQALENQAYTVGNQMGTTNLTSAASVALPLTVDSAGPTFTSSPNLTATVESPYSYTAVATDSVSNGLSYAVVSGPVGFGINASSGVVTWTPSLSESGTNPVEISVTDLAGNTVDQSFSVVASFAPLAVASITPSDGSANIPVNSAILVQFNDPMNSATLNSTTLTLQDSEGDSIAATISYNAADAVATITPTASLENSTSYTVTVVSGADGVADTAGDTLSSNVTASFTTEAPLSVVSVMPADGSTAVPINTSIAVQFDNAMNAATVDSSTLVLEDSAGNTIATTVSYNAATDTATIAPSALLTNSTNYTLTIVSGADGVADTGGETLASDVTASFTTAAPPTVVSITPANDATGATVTSVAVVFSDALNSATVDGSTIKLEDSSGNITSATVTYDSGSDTATVTPTGSLAPGATYLVFVVGGTSGVADTGGGTLADNFVSTFTTAAGVPAPTPSPGESTLFSNSVVPPYSDNPDSQAVELGVKFQSDESGFIVGIRYYKGASSVGDDTGNLWSSSGTLLATAMFTNETTSGWEEVNFSQPVAIQAGTTYIASYFTPTGNYADDLGFFANGSTTSGPLTALGSVYLYSSVSAFPTQTYDNSNYYVDPVFSQLIGAVSPALGATGVATGSAVTVPFLAAMNGDTISSSTIELEDSSGNVVPATISYDSGTNTATLTPSSALNAGATYTVAITGGASGVADSNGDTLSANVTWTFTTAPSAPAVLSVTPPAAGTGVDMNAPIQIQFNEAMNAGTLTNSTLLLQDSAGDNVPVTVSYNSNNNIATLTPDAALDTSATYTVVVDGGAEGVADAIGNAMAADFTSTFTTAAPLGTGPFSLWTDSTTPEWTDNPDPRSVELGVQFKATSGGDITGIRFYQSAGNTGAQIVNLWSSDGTLLATATSSSTTGPGWVEIDFAQPVYVEANTVYVASYFTTDGNYADNETFFASGSFTNGPLTALAGVYNYGSQSAFPTEIYQQSNYWVDVVLNPPAAETTADAITPAAFTPNAIVATPSLAASIPAATAPAVVANPAVTVAPSTGGSTPAGASPAVILAASSGNSITISTGAAGTNTSTTASVGASSQPVATSSQQSLIASPVQSTSATQFGGGMVPTDADLDGNGGTTGATPEFDLSAQTEPPAAASDLATSSATADPADYWLAAFEGLESSDVRSDFVQSDFTDRPSLSAIDACFASMECEASSILQTALAAG